MDMKTLVDLSTPIRDTLDAAIRRFDDEVRSEAAFVNRLVDQVKAYRGKLLRPKLVLLSGKAAGELTEPHVVIAAVVEMVHMATLVHDDVLDEADVRRRRPTVNRMVGNEGAVLLGDYLISHAYHLCSSLDSTFAPRRIAAVTNTVCEGELLQIENRGNLDLTESTYFEIIRRKTAALTGVCCELGAALAGADDETIEHMSAFGVDLGLAFQIVDDLLDLVGTEHELGKTVGRDADMGKLTLPLIRFLDQADPARRRQMRDLLTSIAADRNVAIRELMAATDATDYAMDVASSYIQSAVAHLACLPSGDAKDALRAAAEFVIQRRH